MSVVTEDNKLEKQEEKIKKIDFKMVAFSLAEKDYAINIMKVKEIAKAFQFTLIPNATHYVRGVYNLRGEIIPVIDLRKMFHLNIKKEKDVKLENVIILNSRLVFHRINTLAGLG